MDNVLATVSDRRQPKLLGGVVTAQDYYPFGMEMLSRTYSAMGALVQYDYGFRSCFLSNSVGAPRAK
ncbi:MAG: hypothetical protein HC892_07505 [Saprospiraceae bacterium]|nr:hypothetical protein [Saprospiraceae bacterium]